MNRDTLFPKPCSLSKAPAKMLKSWIYHSNTTFKDWIYMHHMFYFCVQSLVKSGTIPFEGQVPDFVYENCKELCCIGSDTYDRSVWDLIIGIMKGCGFNILINQTLQFTNYNGSEIQYFENKIVLTEFMESELDSMPVALFTEWILEVERLVKICLFAGYQHTSECSILVWTHEKFNKLSVIMEKDKRAVERLRILDQCYLNCRLTPWRYLLPTKKCEGKLFTGFVIPGTISYGADQIAAVKKTGILSPNLLVNAPLFKANIDLVGKMYLGEE